MKIALDYDETYTKDPAFWKVFVDMAQLRGHEIMIVTFRDPGLPIDHDPGIPVYYTSYVAKRNYMKFEQGIFIDVWIDDTPDTIVEDSDWTSADRERWKEKHYK